MICPFRKRFPGATGLRSLTLPSECVSLNRPGFGDIHPRCRSTQAAIPVLTRFQFCSNWIGLT
jgi:hypothetical protein